MDFDRALQLIKTYRLELINFENNDTIIDCGANCGIFIIGLFIKILI